jgi:small subunit ribosomal protein S9
MADEERQDAPQEPEAQKPEAQEPEAQEPEGAAEEQQPDPAEEGAPAAEPEDAPEPEEVEEAPAPDEDAPTTEPEQEAPAEEAPAAEAEEAPAAEAEEAPAAEAEEAPAAEGDEAPAAAAEEAAPDAEERSKRRGREKSDKTEDEVIPGAHLEPDLVLEEEQRSADEYADVYAVDEDGVPVEGETEGEDADAQPVAHEPLDLAADARYQATGKRKTAVARVILKPGEGSYTINGRHLDQFFPRVKLQRMAQQPLETAGYDTRMDVVARIHGGGVASQAGALRHGIARALVEADPYLRSELKRRGFLTRDPRVKERKKAGLKKARKRPQFSKR